MLSTAFYLILVHYDTFVINSHYALQRLMNYGETASPYCHFPDIFSWLLDEMGELPLPRKERGTAIPNPLKLIGVPS
jgi:hypothetical protein